MKPDVAVGFGAYVELPLMRAAAKLGIPVVLHEQNSVPGLANKQSAKQASLVAIAQPSVARGVREACGGRTRASSSRATPCATRCSRATVREVAPRWASPRMRRCCSCSAARSARTTSTNG